MHCKCSSSPAQSPLIKARAALDNLPKEESNPEEGINGRSRELCIKDRSNDKLGYDSLDWAGSYYDKREKVSSARSVGCEEGNGILPTHVATTKPFQTEVGEEGFPGFLRVKSVRCVLEKPSVIECKEGTCGSASKSSNSALSSKKCSTVQNFSTHGANSTKYLLSYKGEQSRRHHRVGCSSTPYKADMGIDSFQLRTASLSPHEKIKVARVFSLHDQPEHTNERSFSFQAPNTPKPKLDTVQGLTSPVHLFAKGMAPKNLAKQHTFMEPAISGGRKKMAPQNGFSDREASTTDRKLSTTLTPIRSHATLHPRDHTQRDPKAILLPPQSIKHHPCNEFLKPSPCEENADAFTMHSPLLSKKPRRSEGSGAHVLNLPVVPLASKVHWDWRSKSMGAKASLKSAVRSLEATFAASRSVSLPKTRTWAKPKDSKPESTKLLERVFVSPIRARSNKQANYPEPIEKPLLPSNQSNGVKEYEAFQRKDTKTLTSNSRSLQYMSACAPGKFVIRPLPPNGYNEVEVTCKPFLPASRSVRCLPAPRGVLGIESLGFSSRKADGLSSSNPLDATSMLHAQLQCLVKDGLPFYTMIIEGSDEMLFARACWQENHTSKEGLRCQYSFHSGGPGKARGTGGSGGWLNWIKKERQVISDVSGVMEVNSTLRHKSTMALREGHLLKVLEFILYDGKEAGVSLSHSSRFSSMERPCQKSGLSRESPSSFFSEHVPSLSSSHLDMDMAYRQHSRSLTELTESSEATSTTYGLHKGSGGHRSSLSLDVWSDSDVPDSVQVPSSRSPSPVELAALVIQLAAEGHQGAYNAFENNHIGQNSEEWGQNTLEGGSWLQLKSSISHAHAANEGMDALGQGELGTSAEWWPSRKSTHVCARVDKDGFLNEDVSVVKDFQGSPLAKRLGMQEGAVNEVTLLLPTGDHSFPNGGTRGPSSLIDRWRSGGSCECGGWDLGCGIKVIRSRSPSKKCWISKNKHTILWDQHLSLFAQGSKQELMLGLSLVKEGEFRLSFQGQLSPLKAFATAVAMLHSHEPMFLSLSSTTASSSSSTTPLAVSLISASAVEDGSTTDGLRESLPPAPSSDSSFKDKVSPFLVHDQTFSN